MFLQCKKSHIKLVFHSTFTRASDFTRFPFLIKQNWKKINMNTLQTGTDAGENGQFFLNLKLLISHSQVWNYYWSDFWQTRDTSLSAIEIEVSFVHREVFWVFLKYASYSRIIVQEQLSHHMKTFPNHLQQEKREENCFDNLVDSKTEF